MPIVPSLRRLASVLEVDADALLVDLWGVVHDGGALFPGVPETLTALAARGTRILFLSNTSRLEESAVGHLVAMGLPRAAFVGVVTSGDVTRAALDRREPAIFGSLPARPRVLHLGDLGYVSWLPDTGLDLVDDDVVAELIVSSGAAEDEGTLAALTARIAPLARRGVPLVCTNPDRFIPSTRGNRIGPGAVARAYAELGGTSFLFGKPHAAIYEAALVRLGCPRARVVAVGDMLETDIAGARAAGIASVLVTSGVHRGELGDAPTDAALEALFAREGVEPDAVLTRLGAD